MSIWKEIEVGSIKLIHHSTSSIVQIVVKDREEYQPGYFREETNELWVDYYQIQDLIEAIDLLLMRPNGIHTTKNMIVKP